MHGRDCTIIAGMEPNQARCRVEIRTSIATRSDHLALVFTETFKEHPTESVNATRYRLDATILMRKNHTLPSGGEPLRDDDPAELVDAAMKGYLESGEVLRVFRVEKKGQAY